MASGPLPGDVPSGATMQPRYMGRVMDTYPVSDPEMENISSLSAQVTVRFSLASLLLGLAASIWTNAIFYTELTPAGILAAHFVAPLLFFFSVLFVVGGVYSLVRRSGAWEKIKKSSNPLEAVATPFVPADPVAAIGGHHQLPGASSAGPVRSAQA